MNIPTLLTNKNVKNNTIMYIFDGELIIDQYKNFNSKEITK